jgi:hypothetical protein
MPAPIRVDFSVGGLKDVLASFDTVKKAQEKMEHETIRSEQRVSKARVKGATDGAKVAQQAATKAAKDADRIRMNSAAMAGRIAAKQAADEIKAGEKTSAALLKIQLKTAGDAGKAAASEVRAREKAEAAKVKSAEKSAKAIADADAKSVKSMQSARERIQMNSAKMAGRQASKDARSAARGAEVDERGRHSFASGIAGRAVSSAGNALGAVAKVGGSILALGGGFSAADAVQTQITNKGKAKDLEIQGGGKVGADEILAKSSEIGTTFGMATSAIMEGLDKFVAETGDIKAGFAAMREMTELATATGADMGELQKLLGMAFNSTNDMGKAKDFVRMVAGQGREGSVDIRDLAEYGGRLTAGSEKFGDKGAAVLQLGAIAQQSKATGGSTSAAEASESLTKLGEDIFKKEDAFKALGIKTRMKGADGKDTNFLRGPQDLIKESIHATGGDQGKLQELFGARSIRGVNGYSAVYNRASQAVKDGGGNAAAADSAGMKAVDDAFKRFAEATLSDEQVKGEAGRRLQDADKQIEMAMNQLRDAVGKELLPEVVKLIPQIRALIPEFVKLLGKLVGFAEWFASNPFAGLGALVLGSVVKDLAAAAIGEGIKNMLTGIIRGQAPSPLPAPAGGGPSLGSGVGGAGVAAIGGTVAAGAAAGYTAGMLLNEHASAQQLAGQSSTFGGSLASTNEISGAGGDLDKQRAAASNLQLRIDAAKKARSDAGPGLLVQGLAYATGRGGDIADAQKTERSAMDTTIKSMQSSLEALTKTIQANEKAIAGHTQTASAAAPARTVSGANPARSGTQ